MPTYLYSCPICGEFELVRKISDEQLVECPNCQTVEEFKQLVAPITGFILNGNGFHCRDYPKTTNKKSHEE